MRNFLDKPAEVSSFIRLQGRSSGTAGQRCSSARNLIAASCAAGSQEFVWCHAGHNSAAPKPLGTSLTPCESDQRTAQPPCFLALLGLLELDLTSNPL